MSYHWCILRDSLFSCFKVRHLYLTNVALSDFPINLHGIPRKYLKLGGERWYMLEECAQHLHCSGGRCWEASRAVQAALMFAVSPTLRYLCQSTKTKQEREIVPKKNDRERIDVKCKNDRWKVGVRFLILKSTEKGKDVWEVAKLTTGFRSW